MLAGALFKQIWKLASGGDATPTATDEERSWTEILAAAALHGAVFALVKAAVDRGAATGNPQAHRQLAGQKLAAGGAT